MKKLVSNYFFTLIYQLLIIITPFITTPYISRVLKPSGVGIDAYTMSIIQMFNIFIILSFPMYGSRQIARKKGKNEVSQEFWSIYSIQVFVSIITFLFYFLFIFSINEYKSIFLIHFFTLLASALDISWFFIGKEEMKKVITRNIIVRIIGIALIFLFVKDSGDLLIFILINSISTLLGQIIMWVPLLKFIQIKMFKSIKIKQHIQPLLTLFLPQVMIQIYGNLNKVVLGIVAKEVEVGFYNQSYKVIRICYGVFQALSQVMLPRISSEFSDKNIENIKKYTNFSLQYVLLITFPMSLGLAALAPNFILWFLGPEFRKVETILLLMSFIIIFVGLSNVFGVQILIATDQQNKYTLSVTVGALMSMLTNLLLVNHFQSIGSAISLIVAEATGTIIQFFYVKKYISVLSILKSALKYFLISIPVYICVTYVGKLNMNLLLLLLLQIFAGILVYLFALIISKDRIILKFLTSIRRG